MPGQAEHSYCGRYALCAWCPNTHLMPPGQFMYTKPLERCTCTQHTEGR